MKRFSKICALFAIIIALVAVIHIGCIRAALDSAKRIVLSGVSLNRVNIVKITRSTDFMKSRVSPI